jgi:hypothetical protein
MAFKGASDKAQASASRILLKHGGDNFEELSLKEQRTNLAKKLKDLEAKISFLKSEHQTSEVIAACKKIKTEYAFLVEEMKKLNEKLGFIRKTDPFPHFVDICRERMTASEFKSIFDEAHRRAREAANEPR